MSRADLDYFAATLNRIVFRGPPRQDLNVIRQFFGNFRIRSRRSQARSAIHHKDQHRSGYPRRRSWPRPTKEEQAFRSVCLNRRSTGIFPRPRCSNVVSVKDSSDREFSGAERLSTLSNTSSSNKRVGGRPRFLSGRRRESSANHD